MAFWSTKPAPGAAATAELKCSFCGLPQSQVRKLVAGPSTYICDRCIGLCNDILVEDQTKQVIEPIALARESLGMALERATGHPLSVRRPIVEALLALAVGDADACRQLARDAVQFGDPAGALLALAAIPSASRTPEDAIHEASTHDALGDGKAAIATLEAIDASTASETIRAILPLHRAHFRFSEGLVQRDEAEQHVAMIAALRARWSSLVTSDADRRLLDREALLVEAHAARTLGHLVRAESIVREHLLSSERDALAWALLFEVHAEGGQIEHASAARKRALELSVPGSRLAEKLRARSVGPFR